MRRSLIPPCSSQNDAPGFARGSRARGPSRTRTPAPAPGARPPPLDGLAAETLLEIRREQVTRTGDAKRNDSTRRTDVFHLLFMKKTQNVTIFTSHGPLVLGLKQAH